MVKNGLAFEGALTSKLEPRTIGNAAAIAAWNRAAPDFRLHEILLHLQREAIDDLDLMLYRIDVIRTERRG